MLRSLSFAKEIVKNGAKIQDVVLSIFKVFTLVLVHSNLMQSSSDSGFETFYYC
jgi:hypothetical protein